jgi:hypothetical protein
LSRAKLVKLAINFKNKKKKYRNLMVKENLIPTENKKPFETVYELKNETRSVVGDQIPSFEEFMKTYEGGVDYGDLSSGGLGEVRGYGPVVQSDSYGD